MTAYNYAAHVLAAKPTDPALFAVIVLVFVALGIFFAYLRLRNRR